MKIGAMYPSRYIKSADLGEKDRVVTVHEVEMTEFKNRDGSSEIKPVMAFRSPEQWMLQPDGKPKVFVVNKTNSKLIARALGSDETDDWPGKQITLYVAEVQYGDDIMEGIRVRSKAPGVKETTAAEDTFGDEDVPF